MAAASLTVYVNEKEIRKFGGNRSHVRQKEYMYRTMTIEQFLAYHPTCSESDFELMRLVIKLNKR